MAVAINLSRTLPDGRADTGAHPMQNKIIAQMAATTAQDTFVITAGGKPRVLMFASTVAWYYGTETGVAADKLPVAANSPLTLEIVADITIYVSAASSAKLLVLLLQ